MSDDLRIAPTVATGIRDRLLAVRSLGILNGLDDDGALLLAEYSKLSTFEPGQEVTPENDERQRVHIVLDGRIRVPHADGSWTTIDNGRGVGVVGVLADMGQGLRSVAEVKTRTLELSKDAFLATLDESFSIARNLLKVFATMLLESRGPLPTESEHVPSGFSFEDRAEPRTLVERVLEFSETGIFVDANLDPIFDVARAMRQLRVPPGHVLFRTGDPARASIRLLAGTVRCSTLDGQSVDIPSGYMLGGLFAIAGRPHAFDAVCLTEVVAYEIQFEDFLVVLESHPQLTLNLLRNLARSLIAERSPHAAGRAVSDVPQVVE